MSVLELYPVLDGILLGWKVGPRNNSMKPLSPCSIAMPRTCIRMGSTPKRVDDNVELDSLIDSYCRENQPSLNWLNDGVHRHR